MATSALSKPGAAQPTQGRWLRILDAILLTVAIACAIISGVQAMRSTRRPMAGMDHMDHEMTMPIQSMPVQHMPEMFIGFAALFGLIVLSPRVAPFKAKATNVPISRPILKIAALTAALSIDISKTSTLGFVLPGMKAEYDLSNVAASGLAIAGLSGTAIGAILARFAVTRISEDRLYLISSAGFMLTSCCAMMPTFGGNLVMCFLMGASVGGLAPIVVAAIRDISTEARSGGGTVVFASAVATAAGFLIAAGTSAFFEPTYSWRIMWLVGIPTGIVLIPLSLIIRADAPPIAQSSETPPAAQPPDPVTPSAIASSSAHPTTRRTAQFLFAFLTGLTGFALTVWTPTLVKATGAPNAQFILLVVAATLLVASVGLAAVQVILGARAVLGVTAGLTGAALVTLATSAILNMHGTIAVVALLVALFGSNAMASSVLPIAAQSQRAASRAKFTAEVSVLNRVGGLLGPPLLATVVVSTNATYTAIAVAGGVCCLLAVYTGSRLARGDDGDTSAEVDQNLQESNPRRAD